MKYVWDSELMGSSENSYNFNFILIILGVTCINLYLFDNCRLEDQKSK